MVNYALTPEDRGCRNPPPSRSYSKKVPRDIGSPQISKRAFSGLVQIIRTKRTTFHSRCAISAWPFTIKFRKPPRLSMRVLLNQVFLQDLQKISVCSWWQVRCITYNSVSSNSSHLVLMGTGHLPLNFGYPTLGRCWNPFGAAFCYVRLCNNFEASWRRPIFYCIYV